MQTMYTLSWIISQKPQNETFSWGCCVHETHRKDELDLGFLFESRQGKTTMTVTEQMQFYHPIIKNPFLHVSLLALFNDCCSNQGVKLFLNKSKS